LNSKLHAVCNIQGKPLVLLLTKGNMSDYKGAALMLQALPKARNMLADRGYDARWLREALIQKGINPVIPCRKNRKIQIPYNTKLYKKRHVVENLFAKLKDWRRIATRYDRCAHTAFSAIVIATLVIWWI
jgi:transposase